MHKWNITPVIEQNTHGYRYSTEPFLLSAFANLKIGQKILDVGTGSGVIPILLLARQKHLNITAVEIIPELYSTALNNAKENKTGRSLRLILGDFLKQQFDPKEKFDLLVSNPPYRKIKSGRVNPDPVKAVARHELKLDLPSLIKKASVVLKPQGQILLAYPSSRLREVLTGLKDNGFSLTRLRHVYGRKDCPSKFFLVEAIFRNSNVICHEEKYYIQW